MRNKPTTNRKVSQTKVQKPFIVITWSNLFSWLFSIVILCGSIFILGVFVGRGTAPIEFDINKIANLQPSYIKDFHEEKPGMDASQIKPIDVFKELKDQPLKMSPEEKTAPHEKVASESTPIKTQSLQTNESQPSEPMPQESDVSVTSEPEENYEKTDVAMTDEKLNTPENFQPVSVRYVIQVASLNNQETANSIKNKLIEKGYPAFCEDTDIKGKLWHRVRIGPYNDHSLAKNDYTRLKESGLDALLFSIENQPAH